MGRNRFLQLAQKTLGLLAFLSALAPLSARALDSSLPEGQRQLIEAQEQGRYESYVEVSGVKVIRVLPEEEQGRRHQKFYVELANGRQVMAVYNSDISERLPIEVGDEISAGGEYIWDRGGGLLHWLHEDTLNRRPHGYVIIRGIRYGDAR